MRVQGISICRALTMSLPAQLDVVEEIEEGLGGVGRLRMLRVMLEQSSVTFSKYGLTKATRLKHADVCNNLNTLINLGWVQELPYEPPKYQTIAKTFNS